MMHYIIGKRILSSKYLKAFHEWKKEKQNCNKNSNDFDKLIGIGEWGWYTEENVRKRSFVIKDSKLFFMAILKYDII